MIYPDVLITVSDSHPVMEEFFSYGGQVLPPRHFDIPFFLHLSVLSLTVPKFKFDHLLIQHSSDDRLGCSCVMNGIRQQCLRNLSLFDTLDVRIRGIKACIVQTIAADDRLAIRVIHRMRQILSELTKRLPNACFICFSYSARWLSVPDERPSTRYSFPLKC